MPSGSIIRWQSERGFGFIKPDDGGKALFCLVSGLTYGDGSVRDGDSVTFEIDFDERKGKDRAVKVQSTCGGGGGGGRSRSPPPRRGDRDRESRSPPPKDLSRWRAGPLEDDKSSADELAESRYQEWYAGLVDKRGYAGPVDKSKGSGDGGGGEDGGGGRGGEAAAAAVAAAGASSSSSSSVVISKQACDWSQFWARD
jgi:cold shock CspA family protein